MFGVDFCGVRAARRRLWQDKEPPASRLSELNHVRFSKQIRLSQLPVESSISPSYLHHRLATDPRNSLLARTASLAASHTRLALF